MKQRIILVSLLTTVLMLTFISPALAKKPQVETGEYPNYVELSCGDFELILDELLTVRVTTFYAQDGTPIREATHFEFDGTAINTKTGTVMRSHAKGSVSEDLPTGSKVERGIFLQLTVPGKGVVAIRAGKIVFDATGVVVSFNGVDSGDDYCGLLGDI